MTDAELKKSPDLLFTAYQKQKAENAYLKQELAQLKKLLMAF